jgi:glutamyl-tRNA reductase
MINQLKLIHLPAGVPSGMFPDQEYFYISTCQRVLYLGFNYIPHQYIDKYKDETEFIAGSYAYKFLLETICGLKSKIAGENEIVSQFKSAFTEYLGREKRNPKLIRVLEKLFQDGITRRLLEKTGVQKKVLLVGNGALSQSLVKLLKKKYDLYVTGRNQTKVDRFCQINGVTPVKWLNFHEWANYSFIVNTIGAKEIIFDDLFFEIWMDKNPLNASRQFIDLGCPSVLNTKHGLEQGVARLKDVFDKGDILDREKEAKIIKARVAIQELTQIRTATLAQKLSNGLEEQRFA